jgi:hypothetical protein
MRPITHHRGGASADVSFGVAVLVDGDPLALIAAADEALRAHKLARPALKNS